MEPELSLTTLLKAITALTATVRSLQDQIKSQGKQIAQLVAICKETNNLVGDKDQGGAQTKPGPLTGPVTLLPTQEGKPTLQVWLGLGSRPPSALQEEQVLTPRKKRSQEEPPKRSLWERLNAPSVPSPPLIPGGYQGKEGHSMADWMLLWVALHRDQFKEEEQMVVWILYHMTDKAADWALPLIGTIIKGEGNPPTTIPALTAKFREAFANPDAKRAAARKIATLVQTSTTSKYVTEFCNLIAELDWNKEAYIAQFTQGLHWKVKELLSTKDSIPDNLEAIFAASIKIDNIRCKNEENRPKKAPAKSRPPWPPPPPLPLNGSTYWKTPTTSHRRKGIAAAHQGYASSAAKRARHQTMPQWLEGHNQGGSQGS
ncbi:Retrotransposon gag protein [Rhizoctonia solani]|uniref:Retrotransposon gag protein n=1 Tax=Rhizoctonia solani TaxID=456999 RepID=A0A8H7I6M6_9AGAM|nr:Retrotransposon gag protein [Rhizoctonia solani]